MKTALASVLLVLSIVGATVGATDSPKKRRRRRPPVLDTPKMAYSVLEVCAALGLSRPTVYGLIERGELRTVHIGRRRLVPAAELERILADGA